MSLTSKDFLPGPNITELATHSAAQVFEHAQRGRLHAAAVAGDVSLFDMEMRALSLSAHGPSLPKNPPDLSEDSIARESRLKRERIYRDLLIALESIPAVPGLVHPLDSARSVLALSRPWPHPEGRTVADEKWMWEILRYWSKWPVMSAEPLRITIEEEEPKRRGSILMMGKGVMNLMTPKKKA